MQGIVFTEFAEIVADNITSDLLDNLIGAREHNVASCGIHAAFGNCDHLEMIALVTEPSKLDDIAIPDLVQSYSRNWIDKFYIRYPKFFENFGDSLCSLIQVETHIHGKVSNLSETAELPSIDCRLGSEQNMTIVDQSKRSFANLTLGLIDGCAQNFGEKHEISFTDLPDGQMTAEKFDIVRR